MILTLFSFSNENMRMSLGEIASVLGSCSAAPDRLALSYSLDSRTLCPGALFFAIRGPRFDGHHFVETALGRGAVGAVVERGFASEAGATVTPALVPVEDPAVALRQLARAVRRKWGRKIVAVTGSTGKTTTKELVAAVLATRFRVHKSAGNLNNQLGVPLTLLGLEPAHEVAVVEMGMSARGEIAQLAAAAEPQVGVVTNVAPVHLEFFDSVDSIALAKRELVQNLAPPATAVLNFDDPRVRRFAEGFAGRVVTFGFSAGADFRASDFRTTEGADACHAASEFNLESAPYRGKMVLHLPGRHNVENALAAIAVASLFNIGQGDVSSALGKFQALGQRSEVVTLANHVTLINDAYNSNPLALERMLETLTAWPGAKRRLLVAGEMLELGPSSPEWHRALGRRCAASQCDWLVAVRGNARFFVEGAVEAGLAPARAVFFEEAESAASFCQNLLEPHDVVLVKGSRGVHLERVVDALERSGARSGVS